MEERLADAAAALFASRGDAVEIRESNGGLLAQPGDPDATAYADGRGAAQPAGRSSPAPASRSGSKRPRRENAAHQTNPSAMVGLVW